MIRHEAQTRGLYSLADFQEREIGRIYDVTGGNPSATKLVIGQIHSLSLPTALDCFRAGRGQACSRNC